MKAINKHTGARIVAEQVTVLGRQSITDIERDVDTGRLTYAGCGGGIEIDWDSACTTLDEHDHATLIDENGATLPETDVELVEDARVDDGIDDDPDAGADLQTLEAAGDVLAGRGFTTVCRDVRACIDAIKGHGQAPEPDDDGAPIEHRNGVSLVLDSAQTCASCGDTLPARKRAVRFDHGGTRWAEFPAYTCDMLRCFRSFMDTGGRAESPA